MIITNYVGIDEEVITIEKAEDLYCFLNWLQNQMMDFVNKEHPEKEKFSHCAKFLSELMNLCEQRGFGNEEDLEEIEFR